MEEQEFWQRLELRICRELAGFADRQLRHYWCDGLSPEDYNFAGTEPSISGLAYCGKTGQERWRFILLIGPQVASRSQVDWRVLLPGDLLTGWLKPDLRKKTLRIEPHAGYTQ